MSASAWRRFCALRDRYAHSLTWLACACERRPALSFVGVGRRFYFCARLCACVGACCVLVTRWARRSCGDCRALGGRVCAVWRACVDARCFACGRVVVVLLPPCGARCRVCRLVAFLRHRSCCITVFISGFAVFLAPVRRCLFLAVLRGFLAF